MFDHEATAKRLMQHYLLRVHNITDPDCQRDVEGLVENIIEAAVKRMKDELKEDGK